LGDLLSIADVFARFPEPKPNERTLRAAIRQQGLAVSCRKQLYLREKDWDAFFEGLKHAGIERDQRRIPGFTPRLPYRHQQRSNVERAVKLSKLFEKPGRGNR
jgi:hypothetical protein